MEHKDYRLAAIMYTDIAGSSRMMEVDESGTRELLAYRDELVKGIVESHRGKIIKTIGDALLVDFKNTVEALQSAMAIQDALYARNKENPGLPLLLRIGLHLGDIYFFENDALGEGINIAARLQSLARPGCICLSQDIYNIVLDKIDFRAEKLGKVKLKDINKEIHAYEITTRNAEFDPDRDKPRPGYGEEDSPDLLAEIRRLILQDTKATGRRMTVDEARSRYGSYGVEADEVIAAMAEQGLIARRRQQPEPSVGSGLPDFISGFGRNDRGEFDANALKSNIEAAVHGIVGEIERSALRNASGAEKARYAEKFDRYEEKYRRHAERAENGVGSRGRSGAIEGDPEGGGGGFEVYRRRLEAHSRGARGGFMGHLASFLAVNGFLWFINLRASPSFLWAAIVSGGWGIGLVSSMVAAKRAGEKLREIDAMPELEGEKLSDYKKLNRMKDSIAQHAATTVMVPLLLAVINFMTGPGFLWFLIPSAAMLVGFLSHAASYAASKPRLERKILDALGIKGGWKDIFRLKARRASVSGLGPYADLYREAESAKEAIAAILASGQAGAADADLAPSLDQYLSQVKLLAQSAHEIDRLVEGIPMIDLAKDRESLVAKESAASSSLRAEYRKSIEEIDKQEKSYQDLKEQSEVVRLRLGSSVNQLKQMRIDIARLQASPSSESAAGIDELKRRTDELSRYLEDLRSGYAESGSARGDDPFVELEREEKRRLADGAAEKPKKEIEGPKL